MAQISTDSGARGREVALHPLDPLTPDELEAVVEAVRSARALDHRHLFVTVQLDEPAKEAVVGWREGDALDRVARVAVWDQQARGRLRRAWSASTGDGAQLAGGAGREGAGADPAGDTPRSRP